MSNDTTTDSRPDQCPMCGTELQTGTIDFEGKPDVTESVDEQRATLQPGGMAAVAFCPNPECPQESVEPPGAVR